MTLILTPITVIFFIAGIIALLVAIQAATRQKIPGVLAFVLWMVAVAEWNFSSAMESSAVQLSAKILWAKVGYIGSLGVAPLFLVFALEYGQRMRWLKPANIILLCTIFLASIALVATNEWHSLVWKDFLASPIGLNLVIFQHGIGFYVLAAYSFICIFLGMITLGTSYVESRQLYRTQIGLLFLSCLFPIAASLVYGLGLYIPGLDFTPISFSISGILLSINISRYHLFELAPIARHWIIEEMSDGIIVLDLQNRLVDINPAAERILGTIARRTLGKAANQILSRWPLLLEHSHDVKRTQTEIVIPGSPPRVFDVRTTPLLNNRNKLVGRLIAFRDISRHKATEATLARYDEEIGIIDQINLAITSGLDLDQVLRTLHEQCSQIVLTDIFYVALYDRSTYSINVALYYENGKYEIGTSDSRVKRGMINQVIFGRQTIYKPETTLQDTAQLINFDPKITPPSGSYVGIPLTVRDEVIGVMSIQSRIKNAFNPEEIRLLERISIQAAIAIENARLYSEVQRLATMDELTGIFNYRGLQELGSREVERAKRFNHPLSALFIDVDDLRKFNNLYSHSTGNLVLQTIVNKCRTSLRSVDVFARFGGDEFVVLLPETDLDGARTMAERLTRDIANTPIKSTFGDLHIHVSIGATTLTHGMISLAHLIESANKVEHVVKRSKKKTQEKEKVK